MIATGQNLKCPLNKRVVSAVLAHQRPCVHIFWLPLDGLPLLLEKYVSNILLSEAQCHRASTDCSILRPEFFEPGNRGL